MGYGDAAAGAEEETEADEPLAPGAASEHRGIAALLNYVTFDRPDTQFFTEELARSMLSPKESDVIKAKRVARYLVGRPRLAIIFPGKHQRGNC